MPVKVAPGACRALNDSLSSGSLFGSLRGSDRPAQGGRYWTVRRIFDTGILGHFSTSGAGRMGLTIDFTPRDPEALLAQFRILLRSDTDRALLRHLEANLPPAINGLAARSQRYNALMQKINQIVGVRPERGEFSPASGRLGWMAPTDRRLMAFASSYVPIQRFVDATDPALPLGKRITRMREALVSGADEAIGRATDANPADIGIGAFEEGRAKLSSWAKSLPANRVETLIDALALQRELYISSRSEALRTYRTANPDSNLTDNAILEALGIGPTLDAYYGHVYDLSMRSGMGDDAALLAAIADGGWESAFPKTSTSTLVGTIREILSSPNPAAAWQKAFPGIDFAAHERSIRRAALASDDVRAYHAMPPVIRNKYLANRKGATGWTGDWLFQLEVTTRAAARHSVLAPAFSPGGEMFKLLSGSGTQPGWLTLDPSSGRAFADGVARVAGVSPRRDAVLQEIGEYGYGLTGLIYRAITLGWPGIGLPNVLGLAIYGAGEVVRPGFVPGTHDLLAAMKLAFFDRGFRNWLDQMGMRTAYAASPTLKSTLDVGGRLMRSWEQGDTVQAFRYLKESALSWTDFIAVTETQIVKPFAAALGLSRFMRENNLHGVPYQSLSPAIVDDMLSAMMSATQKLTVIPGSTNVIPAMRRIHDIPGIGPLATMFLSTPANVAGFMYRNFKTMLDPRAHAADRKEAARIFGMTSFAGTMLAGPYWFFPWLREMESSEDREQLIGALNAFEKRFTLAGVMNLDLARRVSPTAGVFERFYSTPASGGGEAIARVLLGPIGPAAVDVAKGLFGDDLHARRRVLGAASELFDSGPPSQAVPEPLQVLLPGGTAADRILRTVLPGIPAQDERGFLVDPTGRATRPAPGVEEEAKAWLLGSRELEDAMSAAEGVRAKKRATHRQSVEREMRAAILDGKLDRAVELWGANADLGISITVNEVEREGLFRALPSQARAVYEGPIRDSLPRVAAAVERLSGGGLSPRQRREEQAILVAGLLKLRGGVRVPKDEIIGSSLDLGPAPR